MKLPDRKRGLWTALILRTRAAHLLPAASAVLVGLTAAAPADAQGTAIVTGQVIDAATKRPLADVVVTLVSPAMQGEQTVVTDKSGSYRIPNLPPGIYTLRLDADAYKPYSRGGITVRVSSTIRVNAELLPESIKAEEVVVVGKAPTVDVGSASVGVTVNQDFANRIALNPPSGRNAASRSFENLAVVAPGANADQYGVSVAGTTSPENQFVVDGLSVNNPAYGILGTPLSVEFVKEVNVVAGGYMPEFGRATGGIMDVVLKTGSNDFHGSVYFNITPGALEGKRETLRRDGSSISTDFSLSSLRDFGADIGGPIIKDRLWFYAGVNFAFSRFKMERNLNQFQFNTNPDGTLVDPANPYKTDAETGFRLTERIPGTTRTYYADSQAIQYLAKLTYLINQDNNLTLSVYGQQGGSGGNGTFGFTNDGGVEVGNIIGTYGALAHRYTASANDVSLKYQGAFKNKTILLDVTLGWHHEKSATLPSDGSKIGTKDGLAGIADVFYRRNTSPDPATIDPFHSIADFERVPSGYCQTRTFTNAPDQAFNPCPVSTYFLGGPDFLSDATLNRYQGRAVLTGLVNALGHHVIKAGVDIELMQYNHTRAYSGTVRFRESLTGTSFLDHRQYGFLKGPDDAVILPKYTANSNSITVGGFVQDSWQIMDKVTLNFGVRYDAQMLFANDGKLGMSLPNQWSPRVGVIYDFTQQGRSKLFANFARYYQSVPLDIVDRSFSGEPQVASSHRVAPSGNSLGCDPSKFEQQNDPNFCRHPDNLRPITGGNDPNTRWIVTGAGKTPVDPDVKPQSTDEFVVGGEYEVFQDARIGVNYTKRWMNRVIEDMSRDEATTYFIGNPGYGAAKDFPKAERDYDAVNFVFTKSFSNTWLAQASYTVSFLRGNYAGLFRPETGQLDPNINSDFDLKSLLPNRSGPLPGDSTHSIKIFAAKDFQLPGNMDIQLGISWRSRSGTPLNYLGSHNIYGGDEVFILPRGSAGRTPWVHGFDTHLGYAVRFTKDVNLTLTMDIFNLFNFQAATAMDQTYTNSDVLPILPDASGNPPTTKDLPTKDSPGRLRNADGTPFDPRAVNPNFGKPTGYQSPRQFRFGMKLSF